MRTLLVVAVGGLAFVGVLRAAELHVAMNGADSNPGTRAEPLRTIQRAADLAQPGDTITVHEGVYRERVNPPRGGESDATRITYQPAPGAKVEIKGSEIVTGWTKVQHDTWKVVLPNSFFGAFNPYRDCIHGDWFNGRGREHHTGAVYLNGDWLTEAVTLDEVLAPAGTIPSWFSDAGGGTLLNVAWLRLGGDDEGGRRIPASSFAAQHGIQTAPASEGGDCVGWIEHGDWVRYDGVDFGQRTERLEVRVASATAGGIIEFRLDTPQGELLGTCTVPHTGGWQAWRSMAVELQPVSGVKTLCLTFKDRRSDGKANPTLNPQIWYAEVDGANTTIWARFHGVDPNVQEVEINVRQSVFYPDQPGRDYLTVRGFTMRHAATPWAPPTAEQIGLIGTHWSKGWIIENNVISHSTCTGIALGKHGDEFDNTSANTAKGYVKTIERGLANNWNKQTIGHHIVRNNVISHCEQAGIVGSLGPVFSVITGNVIHDIHVRRLFTGAEMAGIKLHAAIDVEITRNHIYRACRGIWLDWMAQGTRVTRNLLHDNGPSEDLFVEVNHGPFLVDNNLLLSPTAILDMSQGGAYAHNLIAGRVLLRPELGRETPFHPPHSTEVAGLRNIPGGDSRFYNNLFVAANGLAEYDGAHFPVWMAGNVFLNGAAPSRHEADPVVKPEPVPPPQMNEAADGWYVELNLGLDPAAGARRPLITTELLGKALVPGMLYEQPDGAPIRVDTDYLGRPRSDSNPTPGPFEHLAAEPLRVKVWP